MRFVIGLMALCVMLAGCSDAAGDAALTKAYEEGRLQGQAETSNIETKELEDAAYQRGYDEGEDAGYKAGYAKGKDDGYEDGMRDYRIIETNVVDAVYSISANEDGRDGVQFELDQTSFLEFTWTPTSDHRVDLMVMTAGHFANYDQGNSYSVNEDCSLQYVLNAAQHQCTLGSGTWILIVDNGNTGGSKPPTNGDDDIASGSLDYRAWTERPYS